jgi:hypothetical protein
MLEVQAQRAWYDVVTSMSHASTVIQIMNRFGFHLVKMLPRATCQYSMRKVDGHHCLESQRIPLNIPSSKWVQIQQQLLSKRKTFEPLSEWRREQAGDASGQLIVHAESAVPRTAAVSQEFTEENGLDRATTPPYLSDLAPSDSYLFSHLKCCLGR